MADIFIPTVSESAVNATEQIQRIIDAERVPITRMEQEVESFLTEKDHWARVRRNTIQLNETAKALYQFGNAFSTRKITSSQESAISGTALPNTDLGSYTVSVSQLAAADRFASAPLPTDTQVDAGTYLFRLGDSERSVAFPGGSMQDFAKAINNQAYDVVQAQIIGVTEEENVLILGGVKSGADQKLSFGGISEELAQVWKILSEDGVPIQVLSHAQDAHVSIEGIEVRRNTNTIENLVPGITLTLHDVTDAPASLSIVSDTEVAKNQIINFVGSYNALMQNINVLTLRNEGIVDEINFYSPEERQEALDSLGALQGDTQLNRLRFRLHTLIGGAISVEGRSRVLEEIGISTNQANRGSFGDASTRRGYLEIDESKLDKALQDDLSGISKFFGSDSNRDLVIDAGIAFQVEELTRPYLQNSGIIANRVQSIDVSISDTRTQIDRYSDRLEDLESQLRREFAILEQQIRAMESNSRALNNFMPDNN